MPYYPFTVVSIILSCLLLSSCDSGTYRKASTLAVIDDKPQPENKAILAEETSALMFMHAADDDASRNDPDERERCGRGCELAVSGFAGGPPDWYQVTTHGYPVTVPLSLNRNSGSTKGDFSLLPTGLVIGEPGTYWASFSAILGNFSNTAELIPLFLVPNGTLDPSNTTSQLGSTSSLPPNLITTIQGSGLLQDVAANTPYSLVATNGGGPDETFTVLSWSISLYKICD